METPNLSPNESIQLTETGKDIYHYKRYRIWVASGRKKEWVVMSGNTGKFIKWQNKDRFSCLGEAKLAIYWDELCSTFI